MVGSDWVAKGRDAEGREAASAAGSRRTASQLDLKGRSGLRIYYPRPTTLFAVLVESIFYSSAENVLVKYKSLCFLACFFYPYVH